MQTIRAGAITGESPRLGVASADDAAVIEAATAWIVKLDSFALSAPEPADTWQPSRLEHQFSVTVGSASETPFSLTASSWPGSPLEWSDFDIPAQATPPPPASLPVLPGADSTGTGPRTHWPTLEPPRRYWTLEDGNFNLAAVTVSPDDLAPHAHRRIRHRLRKRLVPAAHPAAQRRPAHHQPAHHHNSFGDPPDNLGPFAPSLLSLGPDPGGTPDWCLFRQTVLQPDGTTPNLNGLLLLPAAAVKNSPPAEEVILIRDDTADLGWAIEHTILGADDRPVDRYSAAAQQTPVRRRLRQQMTAAPSSISWGLTSRRTVSPS